METNQWNFPGGPVVYTPPFNGGSVGLIPSQGAKISCPSWPKHQNIKQERYYNKFNIKTFKMVHIKKILKNSALSPR